MKVSDLMAKDEDNPTVITGTLLMDAITVMSKKGLGMISIVDGNHKLLGIITDGDLRRIIEKKTNIYKVSVDEVMIKSPKKITKERLAVDALYYIKSNSINNLPVVDKDNKLIGTITWQQIVKAGIVS